MVLSGDPASIEFYDREATRYAERAHDKAEHPWLGDFAAGYDNEPTDWLFLLVERV